MTRWPSELRVLHGDKAAKTQFAEASQKRYQAENEKLTALIPE